MGDASYTYYDSYGKTEEDRRRQTEVGRRVEMKQDAYDRYMDMLMKRAYEMATKDGEVATDPRPETKWR